MIILFILGVLSGIISGMGIGGGVVLIPALTIFLNFEQKTAQAINLIYFIPTAVIAIWTHKKNGNIEKNGLLKIIIFGIIGAIIGSIIATNVENNILKKMFGYFLLIMGIIEIFKKSEGKNGDKRI